MKILLIFVLAGACAFAAPGTCPTATSTLTPTDDPFGKNPTVETVPDSLSANHLTQDNGKNGPALGCTAVDLTFNNFAITGNSGVGGVAAPSPGATYLAESLTGTTTDLLFYTLNGNGSGADANANDGVVNTAVTGTATQTTTLSYNVSDVGGSICTVGGIVSFIRIQANSTGTAILDVCAGTTDIGPITDSGTCTSDGGTFFQSGGGTATTLSTTTNPNNSVSLGSISVGGFTNLAVTEVFVLTCGIGSTCAAQDGFTTFDDTFNEAPEPSTFALLGTALALVAWLRHRRRPCPVRES
jgi:hypothetical protein